MKNSLRCKTHRNYQLRKRLFQSAVILGVGFPAIVISQDFKIELRPRSDANVKSDLQAAIDFQRKLSESKSIGGLSELTQSNRHSNPIPPAATSSATPIVISGDTVPCPPIVIGSIERHTPATQPIEKRLSFPTISRIRDWQPEGRLVSQTKAGLPDPSREWKLVRSQTGANDAEATIRPQLSSSATLTDSSSAIESSVRPANFQVPSGGFAAPPPIGPTVSPSNIVPSPNSSIVPGPSSSSVMPGPPATYVNPSPSNTVMPNTSIPYDPGSLPTYPLRGTTIMSGEPFVTNAPCQFDAYYMMEPNFCMQNPPVNACGPSMPPGYSGLPGNIIPSTIMPNQVPGLYSPNNSGFRPLIGFGQDNYNVQLGRGIIGQPVAYVPGQPLRNFLRYIFP